MENPKMETKEALQKDLVKQAKDLGYQGKSTRIPYLQKWIRQYYDEVKEARPKKKSRSELFKESKEHGWTRPWRQSKTVEMNTFLTNKKRPRRAEQEIKREVKQRKGETVLNRDENRDENQDKRDEDQNRDEGRDEDQNRDENQEEKHLESLYIQDETSEITQFIQNAMNNLSAGHCVEIKFNLQYDYQLSSLVKISKHLLSMLNVAMGAKKFSIKILIDGVIRNTYTGETMERQTPFPNHMFQVRTPTEQNKLKMSFSEYFFGIIVTSLVKLLKTVEKIRTDHVIKN